MTDKERLIMAVAIGTLRNIAHNIADSDGYVAEALACAAIWRMERIAKTGKPPSQEESREFLRSQGFHPGITQSSGN